MGSVRALKGKTLNINPDFPIEVGTHETHAAVEGVGVVKQYIVTGNNFIIAHFLCPICRDSFLLYLRSYGFNQFPKEVKEILRSMLDNKNIGDGKKG